MGKPRMKKFDWKWQGDMIDAVALLLDDPALSETIAHDHTKKTPERFVGYLKEAFSGCLADPASILKTTFSSEDYNQMVQVKRIVFYSTCAHHLVPFFGVCSFAYIPGKHIVGLSKIPRFIHALARRPQVQEKLTNEIANIFMAKIKPKGCGVMMRGYHFCMICRGVREPDAYTETTALRGCFEDGSTKSEFLASQRGNDLVWG